MRVVVQRTKAASVTVDGETIGQIEHGLLLLVGITHDDTEKEAKMLADKITGLRIFEDDEGKLNLSIRDTGGKILSVSQFTLYGDCRKGRRPSFTQAAKPDMANELYETFNRYLRANSVEVETGQFGAMMDVELTNDGPVTLILDSADF